MTITVNQMRRNTLTLTRTRIITTGKRILNMTGAWRTDIMQMSHSILVNIEILNQMDLVLPMWEIQKIPRSQPKLKIYSSRLGEPRWNSMKQPKDRCACGVANRCRFACKDTQEGLRQRATPRIWIEVDGVDRTCRKRDSVTLQNHSTWLHHAPRLLRDPEPCNQPKQHPQAYSQCSQNKLLSKMLAQEQFLVESGAKGYTKNILKF